MNRQLINLVPHSVIQRRRLKSLSHRWLWIAVCHAGLLIAVCVGFALSGKGNAAAVANQLAESRQQARQITANLAGIQKDLTITQGQLATIQAFEAQPNWSQLLGLIAACTPQETVIRRLDLQLASPGINPATGGIVSIRGYSRTPASISHMVSSLQKSNVFREVKLVRTGREAFNDGTAIAFDLNLQLTDGKDAK